MIGTTDCDLRSCCLVSFEDTLLSLLVWTAIPAFLGQLIVTSLARLIPPKYVAAFALGIFFLVFPLTLGQSAYLDLNAGFGGGVGQIGEVAIFVLGMLFFFYADRKQSFPRRDDANSSLAIPLLVAIAAGIHGFGEASAFCQVAAAAPSTSLLGACNGVSAGISYVFHIALESTLVGACYAEYSKNHAKNANARVVDVLLLGLVFTIPSLVGAAYGYYFRYDVSYAYALAAGASIYVAARLARPLFVNPLGSSRETLKMVLAFTIGFICIYLAALFYP